MKLITDFYTNLDILNKIIFWGIIIVIILLIIFSSILMNKFKKHKKLIQMTEEDEDLPIKDEDNSVSENNQLEKINEDKPSNIEEKATSVEESNSKFIAEEYIMKYNQEKLNMETINKQASIIEQEKKIEMPTKPYQKNVLREMSLSQTSPIGLTKPINKKEENFEMAKDLQNSLNEKLIEKEKNDIEISNEIISKELNKTTEITTNKETIVNDIQELSINKNIINSQKEPIKAEITTKEKEILNKTKEDELLNTIPTIVPKKTKSPSEQYLEEVSKKLSEAETPDEIERTEYELEQEENAIISYKELMEKKDTIKTIDEEEAIISIEELMNKKSHPPEEIKKVQNQKLYNITEEEENDSFLKELKQFRKDL